MDEEYVGRIVKNLRDYGFHRNELFVSRKMAKEAANVIEHLQARIEALEVVSGLERMGRDAGQRDTTTPVR